MAPALDAAGDEYAILVNGVNIAFNLRRLGRADEALATLRDSTTRIIAARVPSLLASFADLYASTLVDLGDPRNAARWLVPATPSAIASTSPTTFGNALAVEYGQEQLGAILSQLEAAGETQTIEQVLGEINPASEPLTERS